MARPKVSLETRLAAVNHYLSGSDGTKRTAELFGVERTSVRRWVRAWQLHGIDGITWKNDHHSPEFRLMVVLAALSEGLTMREAAARFNISHETVVHRWVCVYKEAGPEGLRNIKRGRTRKVTKKTSIPPPTCAEPEQLSSEELRAELRYLRAENAYLKKRKALLQSEKNGKKPK